MAKIKRFLRAKSFPLYITPDIFEEHVKKAYKIINYIK